MCQQAAARTTHMCLFDGMDEHMMCKLARHLSQTLWINVSKRKHAIAERNIAAFDAECTANLQHKCSEAWYVLL